MEISSFSGLAFFAAVNEVFSFSLEDRKV